MLISCVTLYWTEWRLPFAYTKKGDGNSVKELHASKLT